MRILCGLVIVALTSTFAAAQSGLDADVAQARKHFEVAELHFGAGEFTQAIEQYRKAHELTRKPLLLFNIGLCQENLGDKAAAVASYRAYLAAEAAGSKSGEARYRIDKLEKEIAAERADPNATTNTGADPAGKPAPAAPPRLTFRLGSDSGTYALSLAASGGKTFDCPKTTFVTPCVFESVPAGPAVLTVRRDGQKARAELVAPAGAAVRQIDFVPQERGYKNVLLYGGIAAAIGSGAGFTLAGLKGSDSDLFIPGLLGGVLLGAAGLVGISMGLAGIGGETVPASVRVR